MPESFLRGLPGYPIEPSSFSGGPVDPSETNSLAPGLLSLGQYAVGEVVSYAYDTANGHAVGVVGEGDDPDLTDAIDTYTWPPCTASFSEDTLPGSLLVCIGVLNADNYGGTFHSEALVMQAGLDSWGPPAPSYPYSVFDHGLSCPEIGGGLSQVPQATGSLNYKVNAPVIPAGQAFYGGVFAADWCENFAYHLILAEFQCAPTVTQDAFSFSYTPVQIPAGDPINVTGRLPRDNPSFVIAVTWNNPGNGAGAGPGFTLGPASPLGSQWQWGEFAPQASGYAGPDQWPTSCPGLSGSFDLGFSGSVVAGFTPVGAFIWNLHAGAVGQTPADLDKFPPNVWVVT